QLTLGSAVRRLQRTLLSAHERSFVLCVSSEIEISALAALHVGHVHRGEQHAAELLRRKRDRDTQHRAENPEPAENRPERLALSTRGDDRFAEWDQVFPELERAP